MSNVQEPNEKNSSTDKIGADQSIPPDDRIQAVIRSSQYQKDWDESFPENVNAWMTQSGGLDDEDLIPIDPRPENEHPLARKWRVPFLQPPWDPHCMEARYYTNGRTQASCEVLADQDSGYLDIRVYLEAPSTVIRKNVMKIVEKYQQKLGLTKRAPRSTKNKEVDMWDVYDMYHFLEKNQMGIARTLWPDEKLGNPAYDSNAKSKRQQISRALEKANRYVQRVEEEAKKL
jgi:hypothetical protein